MSQDMFHHAIHWKDPHLSQATCGLGRQIVTLDQTYIKIATALLHQLPADQYYQTRISSAQTIGQVKSSSTKCA